MPGWDSFERLAFMHSLTEWLGLAILVLAIAAVVAAYWLRFGTKRPEPLEIVALAAFALVIVAEVVGIAYAQRKDALVDQTLRVREAQLKSDAAREVQKQTEAKAQVAAQAAAQAAAQVAAQTQVQRQVAEADQRRAAEVANLRKQLAAAEAKLAGFQKSQAQKRLSSEEKEALIEALKPFAGQKITVASIRGDDEGKALAEDIVAVLDASGWDHNGEAGVSVQQWDRDPIGIEIALNEEDARAGRISAGIGALINVVRRLGLAQDNTIYMSNDIPAGEAQVKVGKKLRK
jgi:hypothetical protein